MAKNLSEFSTQIQLLPVRERFETIFNMMAGSYKQIGVELILLDIDLWFDK